jgi:hypothetical protein
MTRTVSQSRQSAMLFIQSSKSGLPSPQPFPPPLPPPPGESVLPPFWFWWGTYTLAREGVVVSNSDEGTDTLVL